MLVLAGRGFGKTRTGAEWVRNLVETGAAGRIALVAPTAGDCRDIMLEGSSGIMTISPDWNRPLYEPSKRRLTWPNGAQATLFSAEESDRLRGPNFEAAWCDELAAWADPQAVWDMLQFTMRIGKHPKICVTTTPRPIKLIKDLVKREGQDVAITRGSTYENAENLSDPFLAAMKARYEGTRLGRQELFADVLSDVPGALWSLEWIDRDRVQHLPWDGLQRIVVAVVRPLHQGRTPTKPESLSRASTASGMPMCWRTVVVATNLMSGLRSLSTPTNVITPIGSLEKKTTAAR